MKSCNSYHCKKQSSFFPFSETFILDQFLDPEKIISGSRNWSIITVSGSRNWHKTSVSGSKISGSRNWQNGSVSGPRNWHKTSVSGARNWREMSVSASGARNWHIMSVSGARKWHYGRAELYHFLKYGAFFMGHPLPNPTYKPDLPRPTYQN